MQLISLSGSNVDKPSSVGSFSLEIAVASEYIAVSNGKLLYQVSEAGEVECRLV